MNHADIGGSRPGSMPSFSKTLSEEGVAIESFKLVESGQFQEEKLRIRKELRDVRHQLDKDIESLGSQLKFLNILLMPLLLTGFLILIRAFGLARREGSA